MQVVLILVEDIDDDLLLRPAHHVVVLSALRQVHFGAEEALALRGRREQREGRVCSQCEFRTKQESTTTEAEVEGKRQG